MVCYTSIAATVRIAVAASSLALSACGGSTAVTTAKPPSSIEQFLADQGYRAIPMTKLSSGHETLVVTINGITGTFVLDSGAGASVVNLASVPRFGLVEQGSASEGTGAGGAITIRSYTISSLRIGDVDLPTQSIRSTDLSGVVNALQEVNGVRVDGVIGQDILTQFRGVISVHDQKLFLTLAPSGV